MGRISMPQGKGSQLHNRRDYKKIGKALPENIHEDLTRENVTLVDQDIKAAYEEIFGEALAEYNAKQKRADRRIDNYYDHIKKSKNGEKLFYEDVIQWGSKEDFSDKVTRVKTRFALVEYARTFQERNPNLRLIGAYIHMDEASPHLHIDYIPVAHGYSRGLSTRNSLDRAMKEMGFVPDKESRKNNATKLWKEHERAYFADICRKYKLEVEAERKARGSLSVAEYKEIKDGVIGNLELQKEVLGKEVDNLTIKRKKLEKEADAAQYVTDYLSDKQRDIDQKYKFAKKNYEEYLQTHDVAALKHEYEAKRAEIGIDTLETEKEALRGKYEALEQQYKTLERDYKTKSEEHTKLQETILELNITIKNKIEHIIHNFMKSIQISIPMATSEPERAADALYRGQKEAHAAAAELPRIAEEKVNQIVDQTTDKTEEIIRRKRKGR